MAGIYTDNKRLLTEVVVMTMDYDVSEVDGQVDWIEPD